MAAVEHAWKLTCHQTHRRSARLQRHAAIIQRPHAAAYSERIGAWVAGTARFGAAKLSSAAGAPSALRRMPYSGFDQKLRESRNVTTASAESAVWPAMRAATAHANAWMAATEDRLLPRTATGGRRVVWWRRIRCLNEPIAPAISCEVSRGLSQAGATRDGHTPGMWLAPPSAAAIARALPPRRQPDEVSSSPSAPPLAASDSASPWTHGCTRARLARR